MGQVPRNIALLLLGIAYLSVGYVKAASAFSPPAIANGPVAMRMNDTRPTEMPKQSWISPRYLTLVKKVPIPVSEGTLKSDVYQANDCFVIHAPCHTFSVFTIHSSSPSDRAPPIS
jgi:hypothetical protein